MLTTMKSNKRVPEKVTYQMPCNFSQTPELLMFVKEMGFEVASEIGQLQAGENPPVWSVVGTLNKEIYLQLIWSSYGFPYPIRVCGFDEVFDERFSGTIHYLRCVCFVRHKPASYMVYESKNDSLAQVMIAVMDFIRRTYQKSFPTG